MYKSNPHPGMLREIVIKGQPGTVHFFNALAANDPESSQVIWDLAKSKREGLGVIVMILRDDRQQRTESYFKYLGKTLTADRYIIAGSGTGPLANHLRKVGVPDEHVMPLKNATPALVAETLFKFVDRDVVGWAMGNIIGLGEEFIKVLQGMAHPGQGHAQVTPSTVKEPA